MMKLPRSVLRLQRRTFAAAQVVETRFGLDNPVQVRGRKHLPDCDNVLLPDNLKSAADLPASDPFLLSMVGGSMDFESEDDMKAYSKALRKDIEAKLLEHGAVLVRNTPMRNSTDFSEFIRRTGWQTKGDDDFARAMQSRSMTSTCVSNYARTASDDHRSYTIEPHHEYHTVGFPNLILLFCESAPVEGGGEWPVGNARKITAELRPDVFEKFERLGARYSLYYPSVNSPEGTRYNNWETNLLPTKEETENYLKDRGYEVEWVEDGGLRYSQVFPAVRTHPKTGEKLWFNQIHAHHKSFYECHPAFDSCKSEMAAKNHWPVDCQYGDGSPIEQDVLDHIREVVWRNCVGITPKTGDLLVCDNWLALHGRISFPAGERKVFAATVFYEDDDEE
ncbi:Dapdiamide synthesis protein DdaC [Diplonema papillatum]|nr:Dapdiamide synthesis protein DdaC [Diplonema papillatum]